MLFIVFLHCIYLALVILISYGHLYTYIHIYIIISQHNYVKLQLYATEDVANDLDVHVVFIRFFFFFFRDIYFLIIFFFFYNF